MGTGGPVTLVNAFKLTVLFHAFFGSGNLASTYHGCREQEIECNRLPIHLNSLGSADTCKCPIFVIGVFTSP